MAQLRASYDPYERPGFVIPYGVAKVKVWKGGLVGVDATGYVRPLDPAVPGMRFLGVANETVDNTGGEPGTRTVNVTKTGSFVLKAAPGYRPTLSELGLEAYAASDWEASSSDRGLENVYPVGTIVGLEENATRTPGIRVRIDNHSV